MCSLSKTASSNSTTSSDDDGELRRGPWTVEEDAHLNHYISCNGEGRWNLLAKRSGLKRTGKSCRLRWLNYLKPDVKRGNLTPEEQLLILELHSKWGNRWSKIAQHLPGRTDNEIKNYWRTRVQKQARHLKIDSNSAEFEELIRCVWMPRLLQKIQGPSPFSNSADTRVLGSSLAPSQFPCGGTLYTSEAALNLHNHQMYSAKENSRSPSMSSSDSTNISQAPPVSECSDDIPFQYMDSHYYYNQSQSECYNVGNTTCDMETFSQAPAGGSSKDAVPDHIYNGENNWLNDDFTYGLWNMDGLWQLKERSSLAQF